MRRGQPGRRGGGRAACQQCVSEVPGRGCPGKCAGRLLGRYPGSLDLPTNLPTSAAAKPLARAEMYLTGGTGADD